MIDFISLIDDKIDLNVFELKDVAGPTAQDPTIDSLIVTTETSKAGDFINDLR